MSSLRTRLWRRHVGILCVYPLPNADEYAKSPEWEQLRSVIRADWQRRPRGFDVTYADVEWVLMRAALLNRFGRYVQGYMYICLPLVYVMQDRKVALHAFLRVVGATHCYSPVGVELGYREHRRAMALHVLQLACVMAPHNVHKVLHLRRSLGWVDNLCLKLLFIALGQQFSAKALLSVWDFVLPDLLNGGQQRLHALAAAVIALYVHTAPMKADANEYAECLWGLPAPVLNSEAAANAIAMAAHCV